MLNSLAKAKKIQTAGGLTHLATRKAEMPLLPFEAAQASSTAIAQPTRLPIQPTIKWGEGWNPPEEDPLVQALRANLPAQTEGGTAPQIAQNALRMALELPATTVEMAQHPAQSALGLVQYPIEQARLLSTGIQPWAPGHKEALQQLGQQPLGPLFAAGMARGAVGGLRRLATMKIRPPKGVKAPQPIVQEGKTIGFKGTEEKPAIEAPETVPVKAAGKEPWEMRREEYVKSETVDWRRYLTIENHFGHHPYKNKSDVIEYLRQRHENNVRTALFQKNAGFKGWDVPAEVLAEYPELQKQAQSKIKSTTADIGGNQISKIEEPGVVETLPEERSAAPKSEELRLSGGLSAVLDLDYEAAKIYAKNKLKPPQIKTQQKPQQPGILGRTIGTPTHTFRAIPDMPGFERPSELELTWATLSKPESALKTLLKERADLPYGRAAQLAHQFAAIKETAIRREYGLERENTVEAIAKIAIEDWGKDGSRAYDHVVNPARDGELRPQSLPGIKAIRDKMQQQREFIISTFREDLRPSMAKVVNKTWREEMGLRGKKLTPEQRSDLDAAVESRLAELVPDTWGHENYLPQMHPGQYEIIATDKAGNTHWLGAVQTPWEAHRRILDHFADKMKDFGENSYEIRPRVFKGNLDVVRVGRRRLWRTINEISKAAEDAVSKDAIRENLRGVLGSKEAKRKWAGFLQKREGYEGFEKRLDRVLAVSDYQFTKWKHLRRINEVFEPLIKEARDSGRPMVAKMIETTKDQLTGVYQSPASEAFDASIQKIPILRDFISPRLLDRSLNHYKSILATLFIKFSPRFNWLVNPSQKYVTGRSLVEGSEWAEGRKFFNSPEGKNALERHGIRYLTGGKTTEAARPFLKPKTRERFGILASETRNQEIMWSVMFQRARKLSYTDQGAANYAYLRGNVYSQFLPLKTDMPPAFRGAVSSATYGFFRRFPVKNLELATDFLRSGDTGGGLRWLGYQLALAGPRLVTRPLVFIPGASYLTFQGYKAIKQEFENRFGAEWGKRLTDVMAYGLPGLLGMDLYYSFSFWDTPYGRNLSEKVGNALLGPGGGLATGIWRDYTDRKGFEPSAAKRIVKGLAERFPSLRWVGSIRALGNKLDSGEYSFTDASGREKFKGDLRDIIVRSIGARSVKEADVDMIVESMIGIQAERNRVLDQTVMEIIQAENENREYDYKLVNDFNELWMDAGIEIDMKAIETRKEARLKAGEKDRSQRRLQGVSAVVRKSPAFSMEE